VAELAGLVQKLTGSKTPIEKKPLPADDPKQRRPDITKAQKLIRFEPKVSLEQGLEKTIADFRERLVPADGKTR
jgi:UDP-glucuronate decarboxylase